MMFEIHHNYY